MLTPTLAKPGAGLPFWEGLVTRYYFGRFVAKRSDWDRAGRDFDALNAKILKAVEGLTPEQLRRRVLIPRPKGLEDSSRHWSLAMVLEHLAFVGGKIVEIVIALSRGEDPGVKVDIAQVKPLGQQEAGVSVRNFRTFAETARTILEKNVSDRESPAKLSHPWFGPFNARQWHWLLAGHAAVHYIQVKEIKKRL
ncbi:MAG TPA: DinB family protein [bacterium]|nr:DinB family protein [bacterium]